MFFLGLNVLEDLLLNKKLILNSWDRFYLQKKVESGQVHRVQAFNSREWSLASQSVNFLVSCRGAAHECSLQFSLLIFPELGHDAKTKLIYLVHCFLGILTAQEFYISKSLSKTNLQHSLGSES